VTEEAVSLRDRPEGARRDIVEVRMPAEGAYLSVLRTATAGLAARLDFTLDEIEDLRIAVDEACAMLLPQAIPGSELTCVFELLSDQMRVAVSVPTNGGRLPDYGTFAWTVLTALAGEVHADADDGKQVRITMHKQRSRTGNS
jgi:serine/threonine-protein kinase RsbW